MNNKAKYIDSIVDIVVECCSTTIDEYGTQSVTKQQLLGQSRAENVVMTRCILVMLILQEGYSVTTVAQLLSRSPHAVRNLQHKGQDYLYSSRAFSLAHAEATLKKEQVRIAMGL